MLSAGIHPGAGRAIYSILSGAVVYSHFEHPTRADRCVFGFTLVRFVSTVHPGKHCMACTWRALDHYEARSSIVAAAAPERGYVGWELKHNLGL